MTAFIRAGRIVASPFEGLPGYDLKRLSEPQTMNMHKLMAKASAGTMCTDTDMRTLIDARAVARTNAPQRTPLEKIADSLAELRKVAGS